MKQKMLLFFPLMLMAVFAHSQVTNVKANNNGTLANGADDYITFSLLPTAPVAFYQDPYTYTVTAMQGATPVTVLLSDNSPATSILYGNSMPFRLANGTAGNGNVTLTITPNWGSFSTSTYNIIDPGNAVVVGCFGSPGPKTVTYTYEAPLQLTELNSALTYIPKFDTTGGKVLTKVKVTDSGYARSKVLNENKAASSSIFYEKSEVTMRFEYPTSSSTIGTPTNLLVMTTPSYPATVSLPPGISVPASGTWAGDYLHNGVTSTLARMAYAPGAWMFGAISAGLDPTLDPRWVTNATGVATDDDDIYIIGDEATHSDVTTFTSTADLSNFTGTTGIVPISFSTLSGITLTGGGGNLSLYQSTQGKFYITVEYTYTEPCKSIGDFVWRDDNSNGLQDGGEPGVAGVSVALYKGANLVASTITDAYGKYLFSNLDPATDYSIKVTPPANYSFTTAGTPGASGAGSASDCDVNAAGVSPQLTLTAGGDLLTVDAGLVFKANTTSSIGDRVWLDANGNGNQDVSEAGVAGVTVVLYKETTIGSGVYVPFMNTTTDEAGMYLFNNLPNNVNYKVGVTPLPNTTLTSSAGTSTGNATTNSDVDSNTRLTSVIYMPPTGASFTGIDAGLIADPKGSLGDRVWNDLNSDGIQDAGEPGVPNVTMILLKETTLGSGVYATVGTTKTDANGIYLFTGLDPANYKVSASALPAGYVLSALNAGSNSELDNDFSSAATPISGVFMLLTNQDYAGVDMGIHNTATTLNSIGDFVWSDVNGNGVQDAGEPGLSGVSVSLLDASNNPVNNPTTGQPYIVVSDANGKYKFVDLPAGTYRVAFGNLPANTHLSPTGVGTTATDSDPNPNTGITGNIVLTTSTNITTVDAGVAPGASVGLASIGDKVFVDANNNGMQDPGEQGIGGVTVTLYQADGTTVIRTTTTNPTGGYQFDGLATGNYVVGFSSFPSGYALQTGKNNVGSNRQIDSDPNPATGKTAVISLATGEINTSIDAGIYNPTATNSIGDFVWLDNNNDGLQTSGEPGMPGVTVSLLDKLGNVVSTVVTDANGAYAFKNLPNGKYTVQVSAPAGISFATANAGTLAQVNINSKVNIFGFMDPVSVTGSTNLTNLDAGLVTTKAVLGDRVWNDVNGNGIQDVGEAGIPGVTVTLYASNGTTVLSSAITDANGNYLFINLTPGSFVIGIGTIPAGMKITTKSASGSTAANNSDVNPGSSKTDVITLVAGVINLDVDAGLSPMILGGIAGVVWNDGIGGDNVRTANEPLVPGVTVTLKDGLDNVIGTTRTNGAGAYLFNGITPATGYTVTFSNYPGSLVAQTTGTINGSDPNATSGVTNAITVVGGTTVYNIDAGLTQYVPLPIIVSSFEVAPNGCDVNISWTVATEQATKNYELQMSKDGKAFSSIATIAINNNNGFYKFTDANPYNGQRYYRLKVVGFDGSSKFSRIQVANTECNLVTKVNVYPNPTTKMLYVQLGDVAAQPIKYQIFNQVGQVVLDGSILTNNINSIDVSKLASGAYILKINGATFNFVQKVQIIK